MNTYTQKTLYPTLGELLNAVADLFDSKPPYTDEDRFPRKIDSLTGCGAFNLDYTLIHPSIDRVFKSPFSSENDGFSIYLRAFGHNAVGKYIEMMKSLSLAGFSRKQSIPWLIENYACIDLFFLIVKRQITYLPNLKGLNLFENKTPIKSFFNWLEEEHPSFNEFKKTFGKDDTKNERDKAWKWANDVNVPIPLSVWSAHGFLTLYYEKYKVNDLDKSIINEAFFFAKALQVFYRRTPRLKTFETLKKLSEVQYHIRPDYDILKDRLEWSPDLVQKKMMKHMVQLEEIRTLLINKRTRDPGDKEKILKLIEQAELEIKDKAKYNPNWWEIARFRAIWHYYNQETEEAILCYMKAIDGVLYSGSENSRKILREALSLCCTAYLKGTRKVGSENISIKPYIKRLKGQGCAFGFYPPWQFDEKDVAKEEIKIMASYLWNYFSDNKKF